MPAAPIGHFCWPELFTFDLAVAKAFYSGLFGWIWREVPTAGGNYLIAHLDEDPVAGAFLAPARMGPPRWNSYVRVESADEATGRVKALGGAVTAGPFDVPEVGRMAWLTDPGGAELALWQSGRSVGATRFGAPGSLAWTELATNQPEACAAFLTQLFGWTARPRTDMQEAYTELFLEGHGVGGIHPTTRSAAFWLPYFAVADPDEAARAVLESGGRALVPPTGLPRVGTFAILADPAGARFGVVCFDPESGFTRG